MADEQNALRVSQLDAAELDGELHDVLRNRVTDIFKYFKPTFLSRYGPEVNAVLRFVLWKFSIVSDSATVGQQLLDLKYKNDWASVFGDAPAPSPGEGCAAPGQGRWMTRRQKALLGLCMVFGPWVSDRMYGIAWTLGISRARERPQVETVLRWVERGWRLATLLNFLVFLQQGRFRSLLERLLGIRAVFPHATGVRQVGFEIMDRELLWHGFAEFLFFIVPFINFRRVRNFLWRHLLPASFASTEATESGPDLTECCVCEDWPNNPHQIGCEHVFCYYCIKCSFLVDPNYSCPLCGQQVGEFDRIQPVRVQGRPAAASAVRAADH